jgi:hypothetical protein
LKNWENIWWHHLKELSMSKKQKVKEYNEMLQKYSDNREFVKIFRTICDEEENLSGFILKITGDFMLLQLDREFMLDGYAIIKISDFDSVRCNKYDKTQKRIFKAEGILDTVGIYTDIDLTSWTSIIQDLSKYDYHIIIENINKDYLDFFIGPIKKISKMSVSIHNYDPTGKLYNKPTNIKLETIKTITFGDRYSTIFRKYIKPQNPL